MDMHVYYIHHDQIDACDIEVLLAPAAWWNSCLTADAKKRSPRMFWFSDDNTDETVLPTNTSKRFDFFFFDFSWE